MVLLSIFFYTNQIHGGIISRLFFIHFVAPCACSSSMVKILLQIFCMKIWHVGLHIHLSVVFPSVNASRTAIFCYATNTIKETFLIFGYKSSHKNTRRSDHWNDKNDNANYAPSYHMEGFTVMAQVAIFKENIRFGKRKDLDCELFYSELKRHNVSHWLLSSHR